MRMAEYGHDIIKGLHRNAAAATTTTPQTPETEQTQRDITGVMPFFARGVLWAISLAQALAGDLIVPTRPRAPKPAPQHAETASQPQPAEAKPTPNPKPPAEPAEPPAPNLNWMRRVFATRPIGYIVAHICADLCILDDDPDYPYDLLDITQTIADYTTALTPSQPAPRQPAPRQPTPAQPHHPHPTPTPNPAEPATHLTPTQARPPPDEKTP
jgi:hypothetical protein